MENKELSVRFWGVRGSVPCPGSEYNVFGGNTPCIEIRCGGQVLVFDAGSGIRPLGSVLLQEGVESFDLFFTHCHYDHICGLPFFGPLFCPNTEIKIHSGHHLDGMTTEAMVKSFMRAPFFPVGPEIFNAAIDYVDFEAGAVFQRDGGARIITTSLNHPNGCIGYRVEYAGKTICYVSDTEHVDGKTDENVVALIRDADIVIYDGAYSSDEYESFQGYGHSTWEEGARLCELANAQRYVIFHHCPRHDDRYMAAVDERVASQRAGSLVAREGLTLNA